MCGPADPPELPGACEEATPAPAPPECVPPPEGALPPTDLPSLPAGRQDSGDPSAPLLRKIFAARAALREKEAEFEEASAEAKDRKKAMEAAQDELNRLIDALERGETEPSLFGPGVLPDDPMLPAAGEAPDDAWRGAPLEELVACGLPGAVAEKLRAAGIETLGRLSDWTVPNEAGWQKRYTDIDGIGAKKAEQIEEAFAAFWERRRGAVPAAAERAEGAPEDSE